VSLTREQLLATKERDVQSVPLPDGETFVRSLSTFELIDYEDEIKAAGSDSKRVLGVKLSWLISDEAGARILSADDGVALLNGRKGQAIKTLLRAGDQLNGWGEDVKGN
jgi:hypothetical protein